MTRDEAENIRDISKTLTRTVTPSDDVMIALIKAHAMEKASRNIAQAIISDSRERH